MTTTQLHGSRRRTAGGRTAREQAAAEVAAAASELVPWLAAARAWR